MTSITPMLTETRAAFLLSVAPATLRRWRWAGKGPSYVKLGGHAVRYAPAALAAYLDRDTVGAPQA